MRYLLIGFAFLIPPLPGCFPVVATGVGVSAIVAEDRRTTGVFVEDEAIDLKATRRIDEKYLDNSHVNVTSFNRNVLLTGEVATDAVKADVEKMVQGVDNVRHVTNEIVVADNSSLNSRSNDTLITSKVKGRFIAQDQFQANWVKVVTERGVVYLMGLVTPQEGEQAAEIAATTEGVQKVVKVFEYIDKAPEAKGSSTPVGTAKAR